MVIDVICSSRELFGADRAAVRLGEVIRELGHDVTLVVPRGRPDRGFAKQARTLNLSVATAEVALATSKGLENVRGFGRGRGRGPDLTIYNSMSVAAVARKEGKRIVIVREWLQASNWRHRALASWHSRRSASAVCISTGVREQWQACTKGRLQAFTVWDWLDDTTARATHGSCPRGKHPDGSIVCVGRFNRWKGQELLAAAFMLAFPDENDRPALTFLGHQPGTEFAKRGEDLRVAGLARGWVVQPFMENPLPAFHDASLLVLPSLQPEPFGLVVLEGLASGCRVLASRGGGPSDLADVFPNAITLFDRNAEALAAELRSWWVDGGRGQDEAMGRDTWRRIDDHFSSAAARERWRCVLARTIV